MEDIEVLKEKIDLYSSSLLKLAAAYLKNPSSAEDVVQEVFINFNKIRPVFENKEHEKAWFIRVTINKCKNEKRKKFYQWFSLDETLIATESKSNTDLLIAVWSLEVKYRLPIHLFYYEGYSMKEIAHILNEKEATIGTRLKRAREKLKANLGGDYFEE